jgi:hypothetical protein
MCSHKLIGLKKEAIIKADFNNPLKESKFMMLRVLAEGTYNSKKVFVSRPLSTHPFHSNILRTCENVFNRFGSRVAGEDGGGYIKIDTKKKQIEVYGASVDFGVFKPDETYNLLKRNFPDFCIVVKVPEGTLSTEQEKAKVISDARDTVAQLKDMIAGLPAPAIEWINITIRQYERIIARYEGQELEGDKILKTAHLAPLEKLFMLHPHMANPKHVEWLSNIAETYDSQRVDKTLALLCKIRQPELVARALHILGEMAMVHNSSGIYDRTLKLFADSINNRKVLSTVLLDSKLEFNSDHIIDKALSVYETKNNGY